MRPSRLVVSVAVALLAVAAVGSGAVLPAPAVAQAPGGSEICDSYAVDQFSDVADSDYAAAYILCMRALGLSQGRSGGDFGPDSELNRGQMASFLIRLWTDHLGGQCPSGVAVPFTDTAGTTHEANIECLFGLGITQGTSATAYSPRDPLKASQISRFLYRMCQKVGGDQCPETEGSELVRASECLVGLRVAPSMGEATAAKAVTRAQMGVYVVGLWYNLTGKGLPPTPPQLGTATPSTTTTTQPSVAPETAIVDGPGIWVVDPYGTGLKQVSADGGALSWSPDSSRILYNTHSGSSVVRADGTGSVEVTYVNSVDWRTAVWSPDGSRIAYSGGDGGGLWVAGADGANANQISTVSSPARPVWSPDGSRIAYIGDGGERGIWVVGADGANLTQISAYGSPAWSPDGSRIAYTGGIPDSKLWVVGADGANKKQIARTNAGFGVFLVDVVWSPDGSRIAYRAIQAVGGSAGAWVVGADGANLTSLSAYGHRPVWSPDGSRILYAGFQGVWVVGADGLHPQELATITEPGLRGIDFAWSPDGTRIAYATYYVRS